MSTAASTSRETTAGICTWFAPPYLTTVGVDLRQPLLRSRAIVPARTALRITALGRDQSSAGLAGHGLATVAAVENSQKHAVRQAKE
jgi:hypothetical protein